MKRFTTFLLSLIMILSAGIALAEEPVFWNDGETKAAFLSYVEAVTDPGNADFIPETDRLAVFDLDGTLCGEQYPIYFEWMMYVQRVLDDPEYTPTEEQIDVAEEILLACTARSIPEGLEERHFRCNAEVFADITTDEFRAYVSRFLQTEADRFENLTLGDAWFRTTVEAARYLQDHGFTVYVCSGTDRDADRIMIADIIGIPYRQVIGSDCYTVASGQDGREYLDYQYTAEDAAMRTSVPIIKNVKSSKPMQIMQELGQRPVVAFGNSTGDFSMFTITTCQNPYRSIAFCVLPDDDEREVAYFDKAEKLRAQCDANNWYPISMKRDFATIYGDDVTLNMAHTPWLDHMLDILADIRKNDAA